jgi:pyridoxine 4-dehydrogenase
MKPDGSQKNVQRSIDECLKWLDGKKSLDLFECMSGKSIAWFNEV